MSDQYLLDKSPRDLQDRVQEGLNAIQRAAKSKKIGSYHEWIEELKKAWVRLRLELMAQSNMLPGEFDTFDELLMGDG